MDEREDETGDKLPPRAASLAPDLDARLNALLVECGRQEAQPDSAASLAVDNLGPALPTPPFYRGEVGEWEGSICDRINDDGPRKGDACDETAAYRVEWKPDPALDGDTLPVSGCCERHALDVDRRLVARISTHPGVRRATA